MVKPDVKHNYYADLDLPASATVDDVRKAYRKLALQFHPDRNAGREEECIPKFQAIQAANEVLSDPTQKTKYDSDRRKAGVYPPFGGNRQPTTGNPYQANSAYPPPPRRTQPGQWQRPPSMAPGAAPNGADRFSNFPRPSPTARKDPAQDRTNMFRAWQNMNNPQDRQRNFTGPGQQPQPQPQPGPQPQQPTQPAPGVQPHGARTRPAPPPRQEAKMPTEEQIRAGMNYRKPPQNVFDTDSADARQSAWASSQQANGGKPGVSRRNTAKTPKKAGFNPNAPGSDERAAPSAGSHYAHRHRSEDFGRPSQNVPPPPPFPPPGTDPTSPISPTSPGARRPHTNPTQPYHNQGSDEQGNFPEATRHRTPYTSFIGEKFRSTEAERLRRSNSTRDATKLRPQDTTSQSRARSTTPPRRQDSTAGSKDEPFVVYSSSESDEEVIDLTGAPTESNGFTSQARSRPGTAPDTTTSDRRKKTPTPPIWRNRGSSSQTSPDETPQKYPSTNPDSEQPSMQQKSNMYADPSSFRNSPSTRLSSGQQWLAQAFGFNSTSKADSRPARVPAWAIPSSLNPVLPKAKRSQHSSSEIKQKGWVTGADPLYVNATKDEQDAFLSFQADLNFTYGYVPYNLDMEVFIKLVSVVRNSQTSGHKSIDDLINRVLLAFPSIGKSYTFASPETNDWLRANSFSFPHGSDFSASSTKHRSEENIDTQFSPDGWKGTFTGEPEESTLPEGATKTRRPSPVRRTAGSSKSTQRSSTMDEPPQMNAQPSAGYRLWGSDGNANVVFPDAAAADGSFPKEQWEKTFQDPSWTWPPPPPNPPSPVKAQGTTSRKTSQTRKQRRSSKGPKHHATVVDEDDTVEIQGTNGRPETGTSVSVDDGDAMDIDNTPPAQQRNGSAEAATTQHDKDPRLYSVPPSAWRQQQAQNLQPSKSQHHHRKSSSASRRSGRSASISEGTNLDSLRNVEPFARPDAAGLKNLADLSASLPFPSQASSAPPNHFESTGPPTLQLPDLPVPPEPPGRLTKSSWPDYATKFGAYLKAFHAFNATILQHFLAREAQVQQQFGTGMKFLEATGDTSGIASSSAPNLPGDGGVAGGYLSYSQGVREDVVVREAWDVGCEKHADAVKRFAAVREQVRRLVGSGGLVDA